MDDSVPVPIMVAVVAVTWAAGRWLGVKPISNLKNKALKSIKIH